MGADPLSREAIHAAAAHAGIEHDDWTLLIAWAAIGATSTCWRNTVLEEWHASPNSTISDPEMMQANIATTRIFREAFRLHLPGSSERAAGRDDRVTPDTLAEAFVTALDVAFAPSRVLPSGRSLFAIGGDDTEELYDLAEARLGAYVSLADDEDVETALLALAIGGRLSCDRWWGSPAWPGVVDVVMRRLDDPCDDCWKQLGDRPRPPELEQRKRLRWLLLDAPDALTLATLAFLIDCVGIGFIQGDRC